MSEATEAQQEVYDALQEVGVSLTCTTIARVADVTTGSVTETPTAHTATVSPPRRKLVYDGSSLLPREAFEIVVPKLNLTFTPVQGMNVKVGTTNYRVTQVTEEPLQDLVLAYTLYCELLGSD